MIFSVSPDRRFLDWVKLCNAAKTFGKLGAAFALGGWVVSVRVQEARLPYLERSTNRQEAAVRAAGGDPVATINCERHRAGAAVGVADKAVAYSAYGEVPETLLDKIPDCPKAIPAKH